jgi:hypothetical protein
LDIQRETITTDTDNALNIFNKALHTSDRVYGRGHPTTSTSPEPEEVVAGAEE